MSNFHLPLDITRLPAFVDEEADDRRAVFLCEGEDSIQSGSGLGTGFEIRRVEDAPAPQALERGLHHLRFGRVDNDRSGDVGGESLGESIDVFCPVPADIVDAQVNEVGPLGDLVLTDRHAFVDVSFEQCLPEGL